MLLFFSQLQTVQICKFKMNTKSATDFQNWAVKILIAFLKSLKAFHVQNIFF